MADLHEGTRTTADAERRTSGPRDPTPPAMDVRDEDLEPHAGIRYIARLFKLLALLLVLLLIGEVIINLVRQGADAVPFLLIEATRLIVFAGLLWGAGDIALMLIESNHDLRATRILVGRMNARVQRMEEAAGIHPPRFGGGTPAAPPAAAPPPPSAPPVGEHGEP
ncbi:MAG: hypothetical protein M3483_09380 [Gemmatimonadota bacterium]|nr:hypothetical protein [Gemmatimonadota bacterium]